MIYSLTLTLKVTQILLSLHEITRQSASVRVTQLQIAQERFKQISTATNEQATRSRVNQAKEAQAMHVLLQLYLTFFASILFRASKLVRVVNAW